MTDQPDSQDPPRHPEAAPPWWAVGPEWSRRGIRQPGWALLPLRGFLGVTFVVAAIEKFANPAFFDASSPVSVQAQMHGTAATSPIGPLVDLALHAGWVVGVLIALGELAIGLGTLLGLRARLAAVGGALLSLSFFLTISWTTSPYYYGADIVFLFAWTPFIALGSADVLSLDALLAGPRDLRFGRPAPRQETHQAVLERRALVGAGAAALVLAGLSTLLGRLLAGAPAKTISTASKPRPPSHHQPSHHQPRSSTTHASPHPPKGMRPIASASKVGVGQAKPFSDPATGRPTWLVHVTPGSYRAFSAVCTHAGCTVNFDPSAQEFVCPCHGGTYNARTGQVLAGPPPAPLPPVRVVVSHGTVYAK